MSEAAPVPAYDATSGAFDVSVAVPQLHRTAEGPPHPDADARLIRQLAEAHARLLSEMRTQMGALGEGGRPPAIAGARDVHALLAPEMEPLVQEQVRVLLLDTKHHVLEAVTVYQGTVNHVPIRIAEVFRSAVVAGAPNVVLAHNHPSGVPEPSRDDLEVTRDLARAGELLGVRLLDHVIIGRGRFQSLKALGAC